MTASAGSTAVSAIRISLVLRRADENNWM